MRYTALLDANVLHPMVLCDLLIRLANKGMYRARWTREILQETAESIIRRRPDLDPERIRARIDTMNAAVLDAEITGYEELQTGLEEYGTDAHVVAAAFAGRVDCIVTDNVRDFRGLTLDVRPADQFLQDLLSLSPQTVLEALQEQAADTRRPPLTVADILNRLSRMAPG